MIKLKLLIVLTLLFGFTSCIEIVDDIALNEDGSGTLKYSVNLSASKVKISSILALDSLEGKKVPTRDEIEKEIERFLVVFKKKEGISEVTTSIDFNNYIFKIQCDFTSIKKLQEAIKSTIRDEVKKKELLHEEVNWLTWKNGSFVRSVPDFTIEKAKNLNAEEVSLLEQGNYISITRFSRPVKEYTNPSAILAKNKLAVMLKTNVYSLSQNPHLLENTIYLSPLKP